MIAVSLAQFYITILLSLASVFRLCAQTFHLSPELEQAYEYITSLQFDKAEPLLTQVRNEQPENYMIHYVENYFDFFKIFINENEGEFDRLKKNKKKRLNIIARGDESSPYYYFLQAEIRLQWALARLKFEEYLTAFQEVSKAYKLLKKNHKLFPNFLLNKKSMGTLHAIVGTVPDNYKWGLKLLGGMEGTIAQGVGELEEVIRNQDQVPGIFKYEIQALYALVLLHLAKEKEKAYEVVNAKSFEAVDNPLVCFMKANIAMATKRNDEVIALLKTCPQGPGYERFKYLEFMMGLAKLYRLDEDADEHLERFALSFTGQNYLKEAYQKLAWFELIYGTEAGYRANMRLCRNRGAAIVGEDKKAHRESKTGVIPLKEILKGRILFDGGYYESALAVLNDIDMSSLRGHKDVVEYYYRLARVHDLLGHDEDALELYHFAMEQGRNDPWYFACNAALKIGEHYERTGGPDEAIKYYKICLDIDPDEYKASLHHQAKSGINRIKEK